ncbi:MAG: adenine deaminase [Acholeplasma sp.]|jgi:adenine deaminase|nr:MAG: adenine deaminase [Acholeplasma sp.]
MDYKTMMDQARGLTKAELVFKNASVVNVYSGAIDYVDVAISQGIILGTGTYHGLKEIDLKGKFLSPGFIDSHVHIESSMLTPREFAKVIVPKGTTTIIADPHEITNVLGLRAIEYMLHASENIPLDVYFMLPSSVPATSFEHSGASLNALEIASYKNHPRILGLGEVMDYPAVLNGDLEIHQKIDVMEGHTIDGHIPDLLGNDLNAYIFAGIETDHESTATQYLNERIAKGMYVHLREGSATRNVADLIPAIHEKNIHRVTFCTDDKHALDLIQEGHINYNINLAISLGIDPIDAIRMATLNAATCYGLKHMGGIAPGKYADLVIFDDLHHIEPIMVYKRGQLVAQNGLCLDQTKESIPDDVMRTVHVDLDQIDFKLPIHSNPVRVIGLVSHNIITDEIIMDVKVKDGYFVYHPSLDVLKLVSIERHHHLNTIGKGLVTGFGFRDCALGMTIAHDSHNIVIVGSNDHDMMICANELKKLQGGIVLVKNGKILTSLQLEVAGLMTASSGQEVAKKIKAIRSHLIQSGMTMKDDPLIALSFLCLPVIPKLKLTDQGLFDVEQFTFTQLEIKA